MTNREYRKRKRAIREIAKKTGNLMARDVRAMYSKVLREVAPIVRRLPKTALSKQNEVQITGAIDKQEPETRIREILKGGLDSVIGESIDIDREYTKDAVNGVFDVTKIDSMYDRVRDRFTGSAYRNVQPIRLIMNRATYPLSSSVWGCVDTFKEKIIAFVKGSLEAGIDPVQIAKDLQPYLAMGSDFVIGRWADLVPYQSDYRKRIGTAGADYRTIRLVRNEMYVALRDMDVAVAGANPASTGKYEWVLSPVRADWDCKCPENAAGGPYTKDEVQALTDSIHVGCMCQVEPELMSREDFMKDLSDYVDDKPTDGNRRIELWAERYGLTVA